MHIFISINDHIFKDWRKWKEKKHRLRGAAGKGQDMKERQQKIIELLDEYGFVSVEYLSKALFCSGATVRRELAALAEKQKIKRTHGGAMHFNGISNDSPFHLRNNRNINEKHYIANLAIQNVHDAMTIFIDSSSTAACLTKYLGNFHDLNIITNGLQIVYELAEQQNVQVFATGGQIKNNVTMHGAPALHMISKRYADVFFFSCTGFSTDHGTSETNEEPVELKKAMYQNAAKKILLCDHTKMGLVYSYKCFSSNEIDMIITDRKPQEEIMKNMPSNLALVY